MSEKIRRVILMCFQLLLMVTPLIWTTTTSELFEFPKMLIVYAGTIIIVTLWLARMIIDKRLIFQKTPLFLPLLLFLGSQTLSTVFSIDVHTSLFGYYSRFNGGLVSLISYGLLYFAAVSNFDKHDAKKLIFAILFAGVIGSIYAFPEHFGHSPSCQIISGEFHAKCWVQDVQTRVFGTFGQPNWLAAYLIAIIFIPLSFIAKATNWKAETKHYCVFLLFFLVLLFTKSRSGLVGFMIGLVTFFSLQIVTKKIKKPALHLLGVSSIMLVVSFLIFGRYVSAITDKIFTLISPKVTSQSQPLNPETPANSLEWNITPSSQIRQIVWKGAWKLALKYPLFGSGVETFAYSYYNVRPVEHNLVTEWDFLYNKAHNEFLNFAATTGFIGLGAYLLLLSSYIFWSLQTLRRSDLSAQAGEQTTQSMITALMAGFIALCISNFFGFSTVPVQLLLFLFPAIAYLLFVEPIKPSPHSPALNGSQYIFLTILAISSFVLLGRVQIAYAADLLYNQGKAAHQNHDYQGAITKLEQAVKDVPDEALYTDELGLAASEVAASLAATDNLKQASEAASIAIELANRTLNLNKVHLNFYKTRAKIFINLTPVNPQYAYEALATLDAAIRLAPTDAKLWLNRAMLTEQLGNPQQALNLYKQTLILKPNYDLAKTQLAKLEARLATASAIPKSRTQ